MSETPNDPNEGSPPGRGAGTRRSGLDRLRAARGGAQAPSAPPASDGGDSSAGDGGGSTALLETTPGGGTVPLEKEGASPSATAGTAVDSPVADPETESAETASAPAEGDTGVSRRRGRKRRAPRAAPPAVAVDPGPLRSLRLLAALLAVLVVALLVPVIAMRDRIVESKQHKAITSLVDKREQALAAGRQFAVTFFSPDYKTVDDFNKNITALTTGDFNKDFVGKAGQLKSLLTQVQSQATGRVLSAGVSRVSGNTVDVLIFVDQDVKNKQSQGKTLTNRYRVLVTLQQTPKGWLVSNLVPVV